MVSTFIIIMSIVVAFLLGRFLRDQEFERQLQQERRQAEWYKELYNNLTKTKPKPPPPVSNLEWKSDK